MIAYSIEVSICWALFLLLYRMLLSKETFFELNRAYLLSAVLLGLLLPLFRAAVETPVAAVNPGYWLETVTIGAANAEMVPVDGSSTFNWMNLLAWVYWLGVALMSLRLLYGLFRIAQIWLRAERRMYGGYQLVLTDQMHLPFSFLGALFWSRHIPLEGKEANCMLCHEETHIRQRHSLDVLLFELLNIVFWFSPFLYYLKKDLRAVHEYLADARVLRQTSKKQYGQLLLRQHSSGPRLAFSHSFNQSQLKKRFQMMIKTPSQRLALLKYCLTLPLGAFLLLLFAAVPADAQEAPAPPPAPTAPAPPPPSAPEQAAPVVTDDVFKVVEVMPSFPGCEDQMGQDGYHACAQRAMLNFMYENIRYPKDAKDNDIQGTVVVQFIVEKDGSLRDIAVVRDIGGGCGEEVQRMVASMPKWHPGKQSGKTVRVQLNLPVRFQMDKEEEAPADTRQGAAETKPELELKQFVATPNPGNGIFQISMKLPSTEPLRLRVYDAQGRLHQTTERAVAQTALKDELDISHLPAGTYYLQIEQGGKVKTEKLVLVRD